MNKFRLFLLGLAIICCCTVRAQEKKHNGLVPKNPPYTLQLEEDLRFGGTDEEDHYLWANDRGAVTVDKQGNIYMNDIAEKRVLAYDRNGRFVRVVARAGEGPGEFQGTPHFQILDNGRAVASDVGLGGPPRFYAYDGQLAFEKTLSTENAEGKPLNGYFSAAGNHFISTWLHTDMQQKKMVLRYGVADVSFKSVQQVNTYEMPLPDFSKLTDPNMWRGQLTNQLKYFFSGIGSAAVDSKGRIYTAQGPRYEIQRWSPGAEKADLIISRDYKPISNTAADIDGIVDNVVDHFRQTPLPELAAILNEKLVREALEAAQVAPRKQPILGLLITDADELLVLHDVAAATGEQVVDVFSEKGVYLCQITLANRAFYNYFQNKPRMTFRNGHAYTTEIPPGEDLQIVRYRVTRPDKAK